MTRSLVFQSAIISLLFVALLSLPAGADWVIKGRDGETSYLADGKVKTVSADKEPRSWYIMDSKSGLMTLVDEETMAYSRATPEEYCRIAGSMGEERKEAMREDMSPEEKRLSERQAKDSGAGSGKRGDTRSKKKAHVSITKTGSDVIAGRMTEKYTVTVNGKKYEDVWILADGSLGREMKDLQSSMTSMIRRFEKCVAAPEEDENDPYAMPEYKKLIDRGFVMKEIAYVGQGDDGEVVSEIVKLEKKSIPATEFMIPAGYKKLSLREFILGQTDEDEEEDE